MVKKGTEALLEWCQRQVKGYDGVQVKDFTTSWKDGLAFCAILHKYRPNLLKFESVKGKDPKARLETAFKVAEKVGPCRTISKQLRSL